MNKTLRYVLSAFAMGIIACPVMHAQKADYEGVMLQGFGWDTYSDSKWTTLTAQADELSQYFDLIWVPNSGNCGYGNQMGYMPKYWFTNHNSSFGTEAELRTMISTFKSKGTGIIADVVINHRNGVYNWTDFPTERWNGQTWHIGPEGICCNDEVASASGQARPTGAYDTGENFDGARDLDHTNANVQNNCKNYCKFLLEDLGYTGFRYDMAKGYGGQYTKIYNQYSKPQFSVGEYWDGSYDAVAAWIEATGRTSAAFDFPCKYAINDAFSNNNMTRLVWKATGVTDQPAGLIHYGYSQYAVTFIDNHDTYRDGYNKFNGKLGAAYAFILCSPGTPCVFLPHWKSNKAEIAALINARKASGLHNNSPVKVLKSSNDCYMAEVTGSKGKLVVKVGSSWDSPAGYTNDDIVASGDSYCVWSKNGIIGPRPGIDLPDKLYIMGNIAGTSHWDTNSPVPMQPNEAGTGMYTKVTFQTSDKGVAYFNFCEKAGSSWDVVNSGHRYGSVNEGDRVNPDSPVTFTKYPANVSASGCKSFTVTPGEYYVLLHFGDNTLTLSKQDLSGVENIDLDATDALPVYYNMQGVRVDTPAPGLYIVVRGTKVTKELFR